MDSIKVCGIYLAAGRSSRMGENKLALPLFNSTIGSLALKASLDSELDHMIIVAKEEQPEWIEKGFLLSPHRERWTLAKCENADLGQAYSIKCGVEAALKRNPDGIMIILADQPFINICLINELIELGNQARNNKDADQFTFIAAGVQGAPRPPILFFKKSIPLLLELKGDAGARQLFGKFHLKGMVAEKTNEAVFFDIDTKEDYEAAINHVLNTESNESRNGQYQADAYASRRYNFLQQSNHKGRKGC